MKGNRLMNRLKKFYAIVLLAGVILNGGYGFAQKQQPQGASTPVAGSGTRANSPSGRESVGKTRLPSATPSSPRPSSV